MEEYDLLTEANVIDHAKKIWNSGPDFKIPIVDEHLTKKEVQLRIRSVMMSRFIQNSLTKTARKVLDLNKKKFQFKHVTDERIEEDGTIMLKIIYDRINPLTCVGVRNLTANLDRMNMKTFNQIFPDMINKYKKTYAEILNKQGSYDNLVSSFFDALGTSTNPDFADVIEDHLNKWEDGEKYSMEN